MSTVELTAVDMESRGTEGSLCFSDTEDAGSTYSQFYSTVCDDYSYSYASEGEVTSSGVGSRQASLAECSFEVVADGFDVGEVKVHLGKVERDCRICQLSLESGNSESEGAIELGCCCKDDLGAAHKHCAETWFNIKGNKTCEICKSVARNVAGVIETDLTTEQANVNSNTRTSTSEALASAPSSETRRFWNGHKLLNFLLACMVLAFVISWLFHFNMPS